MTALEPMPNDPAFRELAAIGSVEQQQLDSEEKAWVRRQPFLESSGYMLRPRYRPGWVPSWTLPGNEEFDPEDFEDYESLPVSQYKSMSLRYHSHYTASIRSDRCNANVRRTPRVH